MKNTRYIAIAAILYAVLPSNSFAQNQWAGYSSSSITKHSNSQHPAARPPHHPQKPSYRPVYPQPAAVTKDWGHISMQSGMNIQYQAPTTIHHQINQYSWVNGQPQAYIDSSTQQVITDAHRYGLPTPPAGSYWVFENGRYILVKNK